MLIAWRRDTQIDWRQALPQQGTAGAGHWPTWLPRLLSGGSSCEWASWFRARHDGSSWSRVPWDFDQTGCLMDPTALLNELRLFWERLGYSVLTEGQNSFTLVQS